MKQTIYKHLFFTWMLAHALHPVFFGICCSIVENDQLFFGWDHLKSLMSFTCLGIVVSMPALVISVISLRIILFAAHRPAVAITAWILSVLLAINIGAYFMLIMFMGFFNFSFLNIFIPGMIAAVAAILIRYKQFIRMVQGVNEKRIMIRADQY
ncbi:MAG: hypothetical protein DI535_01055 [Citrobacter freundii]|nr:MAG: hypothetical protein DI535_01055 [Citrobacter freundii]